MLCPFSASRSRRAPSVRLFPVFEDIQIDALKRPCVWFVRTLHGREMRRGPRYQKCREATENQHGHDLRVVGGGAYGWETIGKTFVHMCQLFYVSLAPWAAPKNPVATTKMPCMRYGLTPTPPLPPNLLHTTIYDEVKPASSTTARS